MPAEYHSRFDLYFALGTEHGRSWRGTGNISFQLHGVSLLFRAAFCTVRQDVCMHQLEKILPEKTHCFGRLWREHPGFDPESAECG